MAKPVTKKRAKLKGGIEPEDLVCTTPEFRLVFANLFEPTGSPQDPEKLRYSATMLFDKDVDFKQPGTAKTKSIKTIIKNAKIALWGKDKDEWPEGIKDPILDGDKKAHKWGEAFEDSWYLKTASTFKPVIKDNVFKTNKSTGKKELLDITSADEIYSGCYCRAVIKAVAYDMGDESCGVTLYLQMIQKLRDGENLEGGSNAEEHFDVEEAEELSEEIEEQDEKPRKKKKAVEADEDDEEEEKPKKKKKKVVEEEEDDEDENDFKSSKKKKKKKPVDEDDED